MLINPDCRPEVAALVSTDDFYRESHQRLYPIIVADKLDLVGVCHQAGPELKDYVMELATMASTSAQWRHYAEIVKELADKRRIMVECQQLIQDAPRLSAQEITDRYQQGLNSLKTSDQLGFKPYVDLSNVYDAKRCLLAYREYMKTLKQRGFITGIHEIDKRIRGVGGGELLFIIARAGSFKTALLQNFLKGYIDNSAWGATFFSIEMPIASVTERYHEIVHGSTGKDIEEQYTDKEAGVFRDQLEEQFIGALEKLYIIPTKVAPKDIPAYIKLISKTYDIKIGVIGIDYLGLMDGEGRGEYEIVSNLSRECKVMAKEINLPVIVLAQTSRKAGSGDIEVNLDMGRGSGAIEESADFVLGLFQNGKDLICKILKNRKGTKGSCWKLDLDPSNLRIGRESSRWQPKGKDKGYDA
jgi:replicative DNA helicase